MNGGDLVNRSEKKYINKTGQEKGKERPRAGAAGHEQRQAVGMLSHSVDYSERRQAQTRFPIWTPIMFMEGKNPHTSAVFRPALVEYV